MKPIRLFIASLMLVMPVLATDLITPDGGRYVGELEEGRMHGQGRLEWPGPGFYEGEFYQGLKQGQGEERLYDGRHFSGIFYRGLWQSGRLTLPEGIVYEGEFQHQQYHGQGVLSYDFGTRMEGTFVAGVMQGEGRVITPDGSVYAGSFVDDKLTSGRIAFSDGAIYEGPIQQWQPHGEGTLTLADGEVLQGDFIYGELASNEGQAPVENPRIKSQARVENALYMQRTLVDSQLQRLKPQKEGEIEVFALLAALNSAETVFRSEVELIDRQLSALPAFNGRVMTLANELHDDVNYPLATATSLRHMMRHLGEHLGEEDIILVYLTSHGSADHELMVSFSDTALPSLSTDSLLDVLNEAKQKQVVVVSACYSGGFIPALQAENRVVVTAAAEDRPSFGCSNEETMTYFGRAFFETAFDLNKPLLDVIRLARASVTEREQSMGYRPSNPQWSANESVLVAWEQWRQPASLQASAQ